MTLRDLALQKLAEIGTEKAAYEARNRRGFRMSRGTVPRRVPWDSVSSHRDEGAHGLGQMPTWRGLRMPMVYPENGLKRWRGSIRSVHPAMSRSRGGCCSSMIGGASLMKVGLCAPWL